MLSCRGDCLPGENPDEVPLPGSSVRSPTSAAQCVEPEYRNWSAPPLQSVTEESFSEPHAPRRPAPVCVGSPPLPTCSQPILLEARCRRGHSPSGVTPVKAVRQLQHVLRLAAQQGDLLADLLAGSSSEQQVAEFCTLKLLEKESFNEEMLLKSSLESTPKAPRPFLEVLTTTVNLNSEEMEAAISESEIAKHVRSDAVAFQDEVERKMTRSSSDAVTKAVSRLVSSTSRLSHLELWPQWKTWEEVDHNLTRASVKAPSKQDMGKPRSGEKMAFQEMIVSQSRLARFVTHPNKPRRVMWDALSLIVVVYDIMTLPLQAFGFDTLPEAVKLRLFTTIFWSVDIIVNFFTGYHEDGIVVAVPSKIAARYLTRTFVLDAGIVAIDWIMYGYQEAQSDAVNVARVGKVVRALRLLRILRLLRATKLSNLSGRLSDYLMQVWRYSAGIWEFMSIIKLLLVSVVINHFIACIWYALGDSKSHDSSWLRLVEEDDSMIYRYAIAFHWSLCQFTPAPNNYHPQNAEERVFAIGVLLFGFVLFSSFCGQITTLLTHIRNNASQRIQDDIQLREFLSQSHISLQLGNSIITFLRQHGRTITRRVGEQDVTVLQKLPGSLMMKLHYEVHAKSLESHPLFWHLNKDCRDVVGELCHEAVSQQSCFVGHEFFRQGVAASCAYSPIRGKLEYQSFTVGSVSQVVDTGHWLCEAALWVKWYHRGRATCLSDVTVTQMHSEGFRSVVSRSPFSAMLCARYARLFAERFSAVLPECQCDAWGSQDDVQEIAQKAYHDVADEYNLDSPQARKHKKGKSKSGLMAPVSSWRFGSSSRSRMISPCASPCNMTKGQTA